MKNLIERRLAILRWKAVASVFATMLAGGSIFAAIGAFVAVHSATDLLRHYAGALVQRSMERSIEIRNAFDLLQEYRGASCSDQQIRSWRQMVLRSKLIEDVGYQENGYLLCTSVFGRLDPPRRVETPALETPGGARIRANIRLPWAENLEVTVIGRGPYGLVARQDSLSMNSLPEFVSASSFVINPSAAAFVRTSGPELSLSIGALKDGNAGWLEDTLYVVGCYALASTCHVVSSSISGVISYSGGFLLALSLGGCLLGLFAGIVYRSWIQERQSLHNVLKRALAANELSLLYQPIVASGTHRVVKAEALLRWKMPDGQLLRPDVMVAVAEAGGFTHEITSFVIRQIRNDLEPVLSAYPDFQVSINITARDLGDPRLLKNLNSQLIARGISPRQIGLEVTEHVQLETELAANAIKHLRRCGFQIFIDDFGTGYSSLLYLKDLEVDAIKIDKSFTALIGTTGPKIGLLLAMLEMARSLGIAVIAEGVETPQQVTFFHERDVEMLQGWLFPQAMTAGELAIALAPRSADQLSIQSDAQA